MRKDWLWTALVAVCWVYVVWHAAFYAVAGFAILKLAEADW